MQNEDGFYEKPCVVCGNKVISLHPMKKFCRSGDCKEIFHRMRSYYKKGNLTPKNFGEQEQALYNRLIAENAFPKKKIHSSSSS